MIALEISLDADGIVALVQTISAEASRTDLLDRIGRTLANQTRARFVDGAGPGGTPWAESARAKQQGGVTLTDTGRLRQSVTHNVIGDAVEIGSGVIYAAIHQTGGVITPKAAKALSFTLPNGATVVVGAVTMPARPFLGLDAESDELVTDAVSDWMDDLIARAAGGGKA